MDSRPQRVPADSFRELIETYRFPEPLYVTRPALPSREEYMETLAPVWEQRWLTNDGELHQQLEQALAEYLEVEYVDLFCNGTIALLVALQALGIDSGEVITTPFTFPATVHVLHWNRVEPVFCDISPENYNLDPGRLEDCITPNTKAILPVHVYGTPCGVDAIDAIAERHGLPVIYDAAHAFGVRHGERSLLCRGTMSVLSFHATKLFTTGEGGAVISHNAESHERIRFLKNFGIADEETVIGPGINGKMSELQAALGLLQLRGVDREIAGRRGIAGLYQSQLAGIAGISMLPVPSGMESNGAYFPIQVDADVYGLSRDALHDALREFNIFARKYFHPLCSHFPCYASLPSASPDHLPVAESLAGRVLCLPIYGTLDPAWISQICEIVRALPETLSNA